MLSAVAMALGLSLLPPSDRYVRFWELGHPALAKHPVIRGAGSLTEEELGALRDRLEDELKNSKDEFDKKIVDLERNGADAKTIREAKESRDKSLESMRRLKSVIEERVRDK